uniref:Acetyltransferase n=1 Tax=Candidatus Kentrum sp. FM TaxID=2126340 RepID=A0A450TMC1_9GAMM|nr:MAG: acetyltransferase [Candidatus Kentron sp. FM]VFJ68884.1 MAG: acetyltransferase [Candidatus Kentron sp. FM]VFK18039.1 MAG: acetyltransferase [Candidatus Kentron sp. FM]
MTIPSLRKIFKPRRIALLGGDWRLGSSILENILKTGFQGVIYPIDSRRDAVDGISTYPDVGNLPSLPDVAFLCAPAPQVPADLERCAKAGIQGIVIFSPGLGETGSGKGRALADRITRIIGRFPGLRVLGPNSLGFIVPHHRLDASHLTACPKPGYLAFLSESRTLCNTVVDWAVAAEVGFSHIISVGGMLDVGFGDLIDYLGTDPNTRAIILYLQSVKNPRHFMSAARAFARKKPIVVCRAGRFAESARLVVSHTGAMISEDAVYAAAFERAGIVRAEKLNDMFDVAELLASRRIPKGARLAIVGNAGGPAVIATDTLLAGGGMLATLCSRTREELNGLFSASDGLSVDTIRESANPLDFPDDLSARHFADALEIVLADRDVDGIVVIFSIRAGIDPEIIAKAVANVARGTGKPVLAAWMGGSRARAGMSILQREGLPVYSSPEQAVRAFLYLVSYARNIETLYQTPRDIPIRFQLNRTRLRKRLAPLLQKFTNPLNEYQAQSFLGAYGIPVTDSRIVYTREAAVSFAEHTGYPVVLKVLSSNISHKVDVGGVFLDLKGPREVAQAYDRILANVRHQGHGMPIQGMLIQKMVKLNHGLEMILGAKKDPTFGPVIMVGMGGFAADVVHDRQVGLPPLNERLASRMLTSLRYWPLLQGYRGRPSVAVDRLIEVMIRFSCLISDYPEIREFDINPLLVGTDSVIVVDAAVILDPNAELQGTTGSHEHMAIRPYPQEHIRRITLKEGIDVMFRPVRPEDEPLWHKLIACSSERSVRQRFRSFLSTTTHQMALEYCVIDYEREIAIVAETITGERELIGVAHMFSDTSLDNAEYAVIVSDAWQGRGVGGMLLDHCLMLAEHWGIKQVVADTQLGNKSMLSNFHSRGFTSEVDYEDGIVYLRKSLQ